MLSSKSCESVPQPHRHAMGYGTKKQPSGTIEYVTSSRDTLQSIAVSFDTTTSSLMKLNRMSSLTVFPGQTLYVPGNPEDELSISPPPTDSDEVENTSLKHDSWDHTFTGEFSFLSPLSPSSSSLRPFKDLVMVSSKEPTPDRNSNITVNSYNEKSLDDRRRDFEANKQKAVSVSSDALETTTPSTDDRHRIMSGESTESEPFEEGFLKMHVQYITDQKELVNGVMLVTPTALMFDPDADDMVVVRDGCDKYGIMCPMNSINSVAMYNDTSRMISRNVSSPTLEEQDSQNEEDQTKTISTPSTESDILDMDDRTETEQSENASNSHNKNFESHPTQDSAAPSGSITQPPQNNTTHIRKSRPMPGIAVPARPSHLVDNEVIDVQPSASKNNEFLSFVSENKTEEKNKNDESKLESEFPFLHSIVKTVGDLLPLPVEEESQINTDNRKLLSSQRSCSNHMFLCIRARRPMIRTFSASEEECMLCSTSPDGELRSIDARLPEYWFQVPRKRSDHVYAFFLQWSPENSTDETAQKLGFVVMADLPYPEELNDANENTKRMRKLTNASLEFVDDFFDESYSFEKEWEIISIQEAKRRSISTNAIELAEADDSLIPELEKPSNILTESSLLSLCRHLPNRCIGYPWYPVYTTYDHGTSLRTLFRNMANIDAPVVLVVKDDKDYIFGVLCSNSLHISDHYYGTGESFLFTISPEFEVFKWTGENSFFIKGDTDSITFGGGKGTFGLWLDNDLYRGCSHPCETFNNKVLSCDEDFIIQGLEVWVVKDM